MTEKLVVTVISYLKQQILENSYLSFMIIFYFELHTLHTRLCIANAPIIKLNRLWNNYAFATQLTKEKNEVDTR